MAKLTAEITEFTRYRVHGCDFATRESAEQYAASLHAVDEANVLWKHGATLGEIYQRWSRAENGYLWGLPQPPQALMGLTHQHRLIISHWQCCDRSVYGLRRFEVQEGHGDWNMFVGGHGGWSGFYGNHVEMGDLARYAEKGITLGEEVVR